jgi:PAS domain S-box-containing protein
LVPAILGWFSKGSARRQKSRSYYLEAAALIAGLVALGYVTFDASWRYSSQALLYSLVPFMLWSALRFGTTGVSTSTIVIAVLALWGAAHGRGPFIESQLLNNVLSLQLFLFFTAAPFMVLAAVVEENRQASEQKLRASEERLAETTRLYGELQNREAKIRRLVEANVVGIAMWNLEGAFTGANEAFLRMLQYGHEDLVSGRVRWMDLTPPEWRGRDEEAIADLIKTGIAQPYEKEYFRKDGSRVPVLVGAAMFEGSRNEGVAFGLDLSEQKRAEAEIRALTDQLYRENRVSTMGELAASLAHEIKQPISAAMTDARTCSRWLTRGRPDLAEAQTAASRVVKDVARASEIIGRVRSLFKKDNLQHEEVDINELIQEMIALLQGEASRHSISIHSDFSLDLPPIMADRVQLQQVLMNLMLNSIEAMKSMNTPGKLTIKSQQDDSGQLLISVMDTGVGVPPEKIDQIFNAFFTSKPQGTGMGLAISRSIIESHGGRLWAAPNAGPGATLHFTLPTRPNAHQAA